MRYIIVIAWSILCMLAGIQGFKGQLAAFYAGLGWTILGIMTAGLVYVYYKIEKAFKEFLLRCEEIEGENDSGTNSRD